MKCDVDRSRTLVPQRVYVGITTIMVNICTATILPNISKQQFYGYRAKLNVHIKQLYVLYCSGREYTISGSLSDLFHAYHGGACIEMFDFVYVYICVCGS